jgi:hypothetical protein
LAGIRKKEERELDKLPYDLPLPPTEFQQRKETPDKDNYIKRSKKLAN